MTIDNRPRNTEKVESEVSAADQQVADGKRDYPGKRWIWEPRTRRHREADELSASESSEGVVVNTRGKREDLCIGDFDS